MVCYALEVGSIPFEHPVIDASNFCSVDEILTNQIKVVQQDFHLVRFILL